MVLFSNVQGSLDEISSNLKDVEERREILIKGTRDIVMLCSKSIVALHRNELDEAQDKMENARKMLADYRSYAKTDLYKYIMIAEQELVEAFGLYAVIRGSEIPNFKDLKVTGSSYITGLLDCVGEIKRLVYDRMRSGNEKDAEKLFSIMQEIYNATYPFAVYDNLISGIRKKLDVARMLIEDIRAAVTEAKRREVMINAMTSLEERLMHHNKQDKI